MKRLKFIVSVSFLSFELTSLYFVFVLDSPKFIETPNELIFINNQTKLLTINCIVDSNPESNIIWFRNDNELIEIGNKLKLTDFNIASEYTCRASNQFYDSINFTTSVIVEGPPTIIGDRFYSIVENGDLNVNFKILSSPAFQVSRNIINKMCIN